jgi:hypothetical protein
MADPIPLIAGGVSADVSKALREFVEQAPLLKKIEFQIQQHPSVVNDVTRHLPERLALPCPVCDRSETTTWIRNRSEEMSGAGADFDVHIRCTFSCGDCKRLSTTYWLEFHAVNPKFVRDSGGYWLTERVVVRKLGQSPPWSHPVPKRLAKALGKNSELFRRGLTNLGQGYGIAAAAYFRRVIEEEVGALLDLIQEAAELDGDQGALKNLEQARKSPKEADRLRLAADNIPASLRPGGHNPLALLYGHLSGPLHSESEEESIQTAEEILTTFTFLFENLKERLDRTREYAKHVQALSSKKKKP